MNVIDTLKKALGGVALLCAMVFLPLLSFFLQILFLAIGLALLFVSVAVILFAGGWGLTFIGINNNIGWWAYPLSILAFVVEVTIIIVVGTFLHQWILGLFKRTNEQDDAEVEAIIRKIDPISTKPIKNEIEFRKFLIDARAGDADAQFNLGARYQNMPYLCSDYVQAEKWFRLAAKQGQAGAQNELGRMYAHGEVVDRDAAKAIKWFKLAAKQGHAQAQFNLGLMYANCADVQQDDAQAAKWYLKAAKQGDAHAQVNLGLMYENGESILQNFVYAYNWYSIAAAQGNEVAKGNKAIMKKEMTDEQIAEGEKLASEFVVVKEELK